MFLYDPDSYFNFKIPNYRQKSAFYFFIIFTQCYANSYSFVFGIDAKFIQLTSVFHIFNECFAHAQNRILSSIVLLGGFL